MARPPLTSPAIDYFLSRSHWPINALQEGAHADGVESDVELLNSLAEDAVASGRALYLPRGTYMIDDHFAMQSGLTLFGDGPSTVIKQMDGSANLHNILADNITDFVVCDLTVDGNKDNVVDGTGFHAFGAERFTVTNVWSRNTGNASFAFDADPDTFAPTRYGRIYGNLSTDSGYHGIALSGEAGEAESSPTGMTVVGNFIYWPARSGINVAQSRGIAVTGNSVMGEPAVETDADYAGVRVTNGSHRVAVSGNAISNMGRGVTIGSGDNPNGPIRFCSITGNTVENCRRSGIYVQSPYNSVVGNIVRDCADMNLVAGIRVGPGAGDNAYGILANNVVIDTTGLQHLFGIEVSGSGVDRWLVTGNLIEGYTSLPLWVEGTNSVVRDNITDGALTLASAASLSLRDHHQDLVIVTGTAVITGMAATVHPRVGRRLTMVFQDTGADMTNNATFNLAGGVDWVDIVAGDTLSLMYDGTTWQELARSENHA